jgi:hypothetical protein
MDKQVQKDQMATMEIRVPQEYKEKMAHRGCKAYQVKMRNVASVWIILI